MRRAASFGGRDNMNNRAMLSVCFGLAIAAPASLYLLTHRKNVVYDRPLSPREDRTRTTAEGASSGELSTAPTPVLRSTSSNTEIALEDETKTTSKSRTFAPDYWRSRLEALHKARDNFQSKKDHRPDGTDETILLNMSIATILDARGDYRDLTDPSALPGSLEKKSAHKFIFNNRVYWLDKGYFREYDAFMDYTNAKIDYDDKLQKGLPPGTLPTFDSAYFDLYLERAAEAIMTAEPRVQ